MLVYMQYLYVQLTSLNQLDHNVTNVISRSMGLWCLFGNVYEKIKENNSE